MMEMRNKKRDDEIGALLTGWFLIICTVIIIGLVLAGVPLTH